MGAMGALATIPLQQAPIQNYTVYEFLPPWGGGYIATLQMYGLCTLHCPHHLLL